MILRIKSIVKPLLPGYHPGEYFIAAGEHGCGKTTIIEAAVADSEPGIITVCTCGLDGDVSASLYKVLRIEKYYNSPIGTICSYQ